MTGSWLRRVSVTWSRRSAVLLAGALAASVVLAAPGLAQPRPAPQQAPLTAAQAKALSAGVDDKVIVVLRNQLAALPDSRAAAPARADAVAGLQRPVLSELSLTGARDVRPFQLVNAIAATVSPGEARRLAANPAVAAVVQDKPIPLAGSLPQLAAGTPARAGLTPLPGACPGGGQAQLNPQALETIHAATQTGAGPSAQALGYTGAGVKVAFIADGLDINNPDFIRPDGSHVFVDYQDFSGTGRDAPTGGGEAFGDASSIAAQGLHTYDVSTYGAQLTRPCRIRVLGVAPGASLVGLNVFGSSNFAFNSVFLAAINYAVGVDHVNVLNESFGANPFPDTASLDLTKLANDAAVAAGVTVTVSTGDSGVTNTIGSPATDPAVISAGASTTLRSYAQTGVGAINFPGVTGFLNDNISGLSSSGFSQDGSTVDVVAPGDLNWALCTPNLKLYLSCSDFSGRPSPVELFGGTSESAPITAGVAALIIQAYAEAHRGTDPSPAVVKQIITSTAQDIDAPGDQQGAGLVNAYQAVLAARSFPGGTQSAAGHAVLTGSSQLNAVGQPGAVQTLHETVTNDGAGSVALGLSSRTLAPYRSIASGTLHLSDATGNVAVTQFTVPAGQARLDASIAFVAPGPSTDLNARVNLSLIDPAHQLAEFNLPQGAGNYGDAEVAQPAAGVWTAVVFSAPSAAGGTTGPVEFAARVAAWAHLGTLSASSLDLAPGATGGFTLTVATPASPGDEAGSIVLASRATQPPFNATTTIPVTLRALVPTPAPATTFTGTLTGGNGRQLDTGVTAYYQIPVPAGLPALNAQITTGNPANSFLAELVDPTTGEAASAAANSLIGVTAGGGFGLEPQLGTQLHVLQPAPGTWTLIIDFFNQVSGTAISQPFTVRVDRTPAGATAAGLPASAATKLAAGTPVTVKLRVTNHGAVPEQYFVDARLDRAAQLSLVAQNSPAVQVPINATPPLYLVPSHTTALVASATAPAPIYFDTWWALGDPDIASAAPPFSTSPTASLSSPNVASGLWGITPFQHGPDGATGLPPVTAQTSLTATTAAFDPAVSTPTGDLWLASVNPGEPLNPVVAQPGQTVTIPVTITPSGPAGTIVRGTLYLDAASLVNAIASDQGLSGLDPEGSDVAAFGYQYTVR